MSRKKSSRRRQQNKNAQPRARQARPDYQTLEPRHLLAPIMGPMNPAKYQASLYQPEPIQDVFSDNAVTLENILARTRVNEYVANEIVVAIKLPVAREQATNQLASINWKQLTSSPSTTVIENMMTVAQGSGSVSLVRLDLGDGSDVVATMRALDQQANVLWSSPNFIHAGDDPREFIPDDPQFVDQYHHRLIGNDLAWDISLGNPDIRVGVTDDGVSIAHEDLTENIWVNPGEIAGNGIDDDGNGYIDDVNGWDFSSNNNDPNPNGAGNTHGTHVAGITAGRTDNGIGIAGTAGRATIVPMQFYLGTGAWTAAVINETYRYAADNNIQIVSTSFNVDGWVGDPVFTAGLQYMYDAGVLHFNSSGNSNRLNPVRQVFEQSLFVASTDSADRRSGFSNYGTGIDISAPGSNILSTLNGNTYGAQSGTSMATPMAAGAAALIWGVNPTWNRDQVAAQLMGTAFNIDNLNPGFEGLLGTGRIDTAAALTRTLAAPRITSFTGLPANGANLSSRITINSFSVDFDQLLDPASVNNASNYVFAEAGGDGLFGTSDDTIIPVTPDRIYQIGTETMTFTVNAGELGFGRYRLTLVSGGLQNPFATGLDGNGDGVGGDDFTRTFTLGPITERLSTLGSLVYRQTYSDTISAPGEKDGYSVVLDPGQKLTVVLESTDFVPNLQVRDDSGMLLADVTGTGGIAFTAPLTVPAGGRFQLTFGSVDNDTGTYSVRILLNTALENEGLVSGISNDTLVTAETLERTSVALGSGAADRLGVIGQLTSNVGGTFVSEGFESGSLNSQWTTFSSTANGRIRVTDTQGAAAGNFALIMDTSSNGGLNRNHADWTVNFGALPSATLRFSHASFSDETHTLPASFTNSANGDGVAISANGVNWFTVFTPTASSVAGQWLTQTIDLGAAATAAGISLGDNFRIRFQQFDNFPTPTDGRGYDDISILSPAPQDDWFSFSLADGESAALAASRLGLVGALGISLFDADGNLLRTGTSATNITSYISSFRDTTNNGVRDDYFIKVTGFNVDYNLNVVRGAEFDRESNNVANTNSAQNLDGLRGALGFSIVGNNDFYRVTANAGETIRFDAHLPAGGPALFINSLTSGESSNLRLALLSPGLTEVATGIDSVSFTAPAAGTYYLRVSSLGTSGEYFVERVATQAPSLETGSIPRVGVDNVRVSFNRTFVDPVVILSPATTLTNEPMLASVSNVGPNGFDVRLINWNFFSEDEVFENLSYFVIEKGVTVLPDGSKLIAGVANVSENSFERQTFASPFSTVPVVLTSANLGFNDFLRSTRIRSASTTGFELTTQFPESAQALDDNVTPVHYLALEPGRYTFGDWTFEAGFTPTMVSHLPLAFNFQLPFPTAPTLLANIQTNNENDPAVLRMSNVSSSGATLFVSEEQTRDLEMNHAPEQVGYLALFRNSTIGTGGPGGGPLGPGGSGESLQSINAALPLIDAPALASVEPWLSSRSDRNQSRQEFSWRPETADFDRVNKPTSITTVTPVSDPLVAASRVSKVARPTGTTNGTIESLATELDRVFEVLEL